MSDLTRKIVLIGDVGVGKTSLIRQFVESTFSDQYYSTIGVKIDKKVIQYKDWTVKLMLWDLAGEIFNSPLFQTYSLGAHGIIGVYDLTRPSTLTSVKIEIEKIKKLDDINCVLIGNKIDLVENPNSISKDDGYDYLTSAKTAENVEDAFLTIAQKTI